MKREKKGQPMPSTLDELQEFKAGTKLVRQQARQSVSLNTWSQYLAPLFDALEIELEQQIENVANETVEVDYGHDEELEFDDSEKE